MSKKIDLTGQKFGKLTVIEENGRGKRGEVLWLCVCDCGNKRNKSASFLRKKSTFSCGCEKKEAAKKAFTSHGLSQTPTYNVWQSMKDRCLNPKNCVYHNYGARGIKVCDRWINSFENFYSDMGEKPKHLSIERIDNNGDYEPSNCRWATAREQCANRRRSSHVTIDGETKNISEWSRVSGIGRSTIRRRFDAGITGRRLLSREKVYI